MVKKPSPEELARFIEIYERRREIKRLQEEAKRRQHNDDVYGIYAKYQKRRTDYRGK